MTDTFFEFQKAELESSIPDRFQRQVLKYPNRLAIKAKDVELTYSELNARANRVAHAILSQRGPSQEQIALLFQMTPALIEATMGVLKAGKTYVPLDPSHPPERLGHILEDSQASTLVTDRLHLAMAQGIATNGQQIIDIDGLDSHYPSSNLGLSISPDALSYILYTSGSTGQPKGVVQNHRNVLYMAMITHVVPICPQDRVSLLYSLGFVGAAKDTFSTLLNGASLHPFDLRHEGVAQIARWIVEDRITIFRAVPTVFRQFVNTLTGVETFPSVRHVYLGGEMVHRRDVDLLKKHFPENCHFGIGLGSTEQSPILCASIGKETPALRDTVSVGYPVEGTEVLLQNEHGEEVQPGEVGEIVVKSRYLTLGYWRRPEESRRAFPPNTAGDGKRIFRTGDLGQRLPDGQLVCLGRKDFQVKVRGQRVELAEVEMALLDSGLVKEAVVVAEESRDQNGRLVAYFVADGEPGPGPSELRRALENKLPQYMVPSAFVRLQALPLNATGKVDRRSLQSPGSTRPHIETCYVVPRNPIESLLAEIWAEVLELDRVGVEDNFLELGGDSLLAGLLISRAIPAFQVDMPLSDLFEAPTVAQMALIIAQRKAYKLDPEELDRMLRELEVHAEDQQSEVTR